LHFAGDVFVLAFGRQCGVVRDLSGFLFDVAFHFMKLALDLIFRARFHLCSPLSFAHVPLPAPTRISPASTTEQNQHQENYQ
jgi:hypothetical protein